MDFNTVLVPKCCSLVWICYERYSYWLFSTFVGQVQYRQAEDLCSEHSRKSHAAEETGKMGPGVLIFTGSPKLYNNGTYLDQEYF